MREFYRKKFNLGKRVDINDPRHDEKSSNFDQVLSLKIACLAVVTGSTLKYLVNIRLSYFT